MKIYESIILACSYRTATGFCKLTVHLFFFQTYNLCSRWDPSCAFLQGTWSGAGIPYSCKSLTQSLLKWTERFWVSYGLINDREQENKVEAGACHPLSRSPNSRGLLTTRLTLLLSIRSNVFLSQSHGNSVSISRPAQKHLTQCKSELRSLKSLFSFLATTHVISGCSVQITNKFFNLLVPLKGPLWHSLISYWLWLQKTSIVNKQHKICHSRLPHCNIWNEEHLGKDQSLTSSTEWVDFPRLYCRSRNTDTPRVQNMHRTITTTGMEIILFPFLLLLLQLKSTNQNHLNVGIKWWQYCHSIRNAFSPNSAA